MEALPLECDLLNLEATIGPGSATPFYIGPAENDGLRQLNLRLPEGIATGLQPLRLNWLGRPLAPEVTLRVVPPGPAVPRIIAAGDAVDLLAGARIRSGIVKIVLEEVARIEDFRATIDGLPVEHVETFRVDPVAMRFEVNIPLPAGLSNGPHSLGICLGKRRFPQIRLEAGP
jgi:hypothetical protein